MVLRTSRKYETLNRMKNAGSFTEESIVMHNRTANVKTVVEENIKISIIQTLDVEGEIRDDSEEGNMESITIPMSH